MTVTSKTVFAAFTLAAWLVGGTALTGHALAQMDPASSTPSANGAVAQQPIDINSASMKELRSLPGIGPAYSKRIVEHRPYKTVEELRSRKVLPAATYKKIQDKVVANGR